MDGCVGDRLNEGLCRSRVGATGTGVSVLRDARFQYPGELPDLPDLVHFLLHPADDRHPYPVHQNGNSDTASRGVPQPGRLGSREETNQFEEGHHPDVE